MSRMSPPTGPVTWCSTRRLVLPSILVPLLSASVSLAAGVVGTGSPGSCTEANLVTALAGGGLVTFNCGATPHVITVTSEKAIVADTEIDGGGLVTLSGGDATRILSAGAGIALTLRRITLNSGYVSTLPARGGAVYCAGCDLEVTDSTFDDNHINSIQTEGGAIWFGPPPAGGDSGSLLVVRSTFSNNSATSAWSYAGAIYINNTTSTSYIVASTFSGNIAGGAWLGEGGAVRLTGDEDLEIVNCTFAGNSAPNGAIGGALFASSGSQSLVLVNTIVANSVSSSNCGGAGTFVDGGNNLQFGGTVANSCGVSIPTPGGDPLGGNSLADNGGYAMTIALPLGSAAINAGDNDACDDSPPLGPGGGDERGFAHVETCDIGAFEWGARDPLAQPVPVLHPIGMALLALAIAALATLLLRRV